MFIPGSHESGLVAKCGTFEPWRSPTGGGTRPPYCASLSGQDYTGQPLHGANLPAEAMAFGPRL